MILFENYFSHVEKCKMWILLNKNNRFIIISALEEEMETKVNNLRITEICGNVSTTSLIRGETDIKFRALANDRIIKSSRNSSED